MTILQVRRGTTSQWTTSNPVLAQGEPGYDTTTGIFKVGNGVLTWAALPSFSAGATSANNSLGIVAMGSTIGTNVAVGAGATIDVSNVISFTPLIGRRYRLVFRARAIAGAAGQCNVQIVGTNIGTNDTWRYVASNFMAIETELVFDGTGVASTYKVQFTPQNATTIYTDQPIGQFYIEDVGPNQSPALPVADPPPSWITVTGMANGWLNPQGAGQPLAQYRKLGDITYLRGTIGQGTLNATAFTMPVSFRPPNQVVFNCVSGNSGYSSVVVNADGTVVVQYASAAGGAAYVSLSPIFYSITT